MEERGGPAASKGDMGGKHDPQGDGGASGVCRTDRGQAACMGRWMG